MIPTKKAERFGRFILLILIVAACAFAGVPAAESANQDILVNGQPFKLDQGGLQINPDGSITVNMYDPDPALGFFKTITGTVTGAYGAEVFLKASGSSSGVAKFTRIDRNGGFHFDNLPDGSFEVIPVLESFSFTPPSAMVTINSSSQPPVSPATVQFAAAPALALSSCTISSYALVIATSSSTAATMNANGSSAGSASSTSPIVMTFNSGTSVSVTAAATAGGNNFSGWSGCDGTSGLSCTVIMNTGRTVTASYNPPVPYALTVASSGASGVAMTITPNDNNNNGNGPTPVSRTYTSGTSVNVTAPASVAGYTFSYWSGCDSTAGSPATACTVAVNSAKTVTANYTPLYSLTVNSNLNGTAVSGVAMTVNPADASQQSNGSTILTRSYSGGSSVTVTAPSTYNGVAFTSWTGCDSVSGYACTVSMSANKTVTVNYGTAPTPYTLTVASSGALGVSMTITPNDNSGLGNGTTPVTRSYNTGASVTVTAPAVAGYTFSNWTGDCTGTQSTCNVTMSANRNVTANYTSSGGTGCGLCDGSSWDNPKLLTVNQTQYNIPIGPNQKMFYKSTVPMANTNMEAHFSTNNTQQEIHMMLSEDPTGGILTTYSNVLALYRNSKAWGSPYFTSTSPRVWAGFLSSGAGENIIVSQNSSLVSRVSDYYLMFSNESNATVYLTGFQLQSSP
ncbi:MAG: InlB B-repeat-containing protein [Nitrospiraceae bacterium]|nr:InlB B-repeat-containing protein [Nitrospiraceae bacterium]